MFIIGVRFIDLNAVDYRGWCFLGPTHMTDAGQEVVAWEIAEALT